MLQYDFFNADWSLSVAQESAGQQPVLGLLGRLKGIFLCTGSPHGWLSARARRMMQGDCAPVYNFLDFVVDLRIASVKIS